MFLFSLIICLTSFCYLNLWQQKIQQQTEKEQISVVNSKLFVEPDEFTINGDLLRFSARWLGQNQDILVYYRFHSKKEKEEFEKIQVPFVAETTGNVDSIKEPTNENEFDFRRFMLTKNISNELQAKKMTVLPVLGNVGIKYGFSSYLHVLRKKMIDHLEKISQPLGWFTQVLLIGYQSESFQESMDQINKLGLLYLFTLSGMHVYYLVNLIRYLTRKMRVTQENTDILLLLILPIYGIIGGGSLGLLRSLLMSWLHIFSRRFSSVPLTGIETWSLVLLLNLIVTPAAIFSLGAQLSYLLTLILLLDHHKNQFIVGLKMGGFTIPLVLWHTYTWNIWTIPLSIMIGPIFDWFIFPVVIIGTFFSPLRGVCNQALIVLQWFFGWSSDLPGTIIFGKPPVLFVFIWLTLMLFYQITEQKIKLTVCLILSYTIAFCVIHFPIENEVTYFDIGQGDCSLIKTRFNKQIYLIDTGGKLTFNTEKWQIRNSRTNGETVVVNYLHSKGISRIDRLYLTHQDTDHVGNFPSISKNITVKQLMIPAGMEKLASFQRRLLISNVDPHVVKAVTDQAYPGKGLDLIQILHPFQSGAGKNEDSLVLLYQLYGKKFLFTGDLDQKNELKVIQKYPSLTADVMKTGHHGSKTANAPDFIEHLKPKLAIISAGRNNRYGHPDQETLLTLQKSAVPYLVTAKSGMIKIRTTFKGNFSVQTFNNNNNEEKKVKHAS